VTSRDAPPHDLDAEDAVLGAAIMKGSSVDDARELIGPQDFYRPANSELFHTILSMRDAGDPIDAVTLSAELSRIGALERVGGTTRLVSLMSGAPAWGKASVQKYARIVEGHSVRRKLLGVALEIRQLAEIDSGVGPGEALESAAELIAGIDMAGIALPSDVWQLDEFLARPNKDRAKWVVPGLLRARWRVLVVAAEGVGKTTLFRQIGIMAAQGEHPLSGVSIPPARVLIVDLENPEDSIDDVCAPILVEARHAAGDRYDGERAWLWHREQGIDLRSRVSRSEFETVLAHTRPDLVCIGPLYKSYRVGGRENDELAGGEVMHVLDDLRVRYGFALLMEHHAPKGAGGARREMMPYGSSLWLRWPEIGLAMAVDEGDPTSVKLGRFRGDRLPNSWPAHLTRSKPLPWSGVWADGTLRDPDARSREHDSRAVRPEWDEDELF